MQQVVHDGNINSLEIRFADTGAHIHLHSNLPPEIMCFSNEPIPEVLSDRTIAKFGKEAPFRHREVMQKWVQSVFHRGGHGNLIEFNTSVEQVEKIGNEWILTLRKAAPESDQDIWWQEHFDAVVVATGHYNVPAVPQIPGLVEFDEKYPGRIQHSKHYQTVERYRDKRVIVVGGSVSAFDTLHDVRMVSKLPVISSLRRPSPVFGPAPFTHPDFLNRPAIAALDADTGRITFADGTYADDVDVVLFATGYEFSFPFLPDVVPKNGRIPGLYHHVFKASDPSLAFIGMVTGSFGLRIFEWQAVAIARVFAGRSALPSRNEMEDWEQQRLTERGDSAAFWVLMPDFKRYFDDLWAIAGEPADGTTGRRLPRYEEAWGERFWAFVAWRVGLWKEDAAEAKARSERASPP
ncbi:hypothetical protein N0V90_008018 [Kalmusia sp. IMI 367209]|nr:hypothetical protein N0V90_008018 [Kalmusia sp. IMI 367209]